MVNGTGNVTGTGAGFDGIHAEIDNANDSADVIVSQTGSVSGGHDGIDAVTCGNGNVSVTTAANATVAAAALFGIEAQSFGPGDVLVTTAMGDQINSPSTGIHAENYATAISPSAGSAVTVNAYGSINFGSVVPSGGHPRGILAWYAGDASGTGTPNANVFGDVTVNNYANITQNYDLVAVDAGDGIGAFNFGNGNITVIDGTLNNVPGGPGTSINVARYGIMVQAYENNQVVVSMAAGDSIVSGSSGIFAFNAATAIDALANSKITITADGTITSGQNSAVNGGSAGIFAAYNGALNGPFVPDLAVTGTILVNNNADITAAAGWGIDAYNYGNGDVTVHDTALTVSGAQIGIGAYQNSGGTGGVTVTVAAGSTVTGVAGDAIDANNNNGGTGNVSVTAGANATLTGGFHGIVASSIGPGSILISTVAGDVVNAASRGLFAYNDATAISQAAASTIEVDGYGAINFGSTLTAQGNRPRAIFAGYNGDASASGTPNTNVFGDVTVNNYANLTQTYNGVAADAGDGIAAFNDEIGDITVNDGTLNNLGVQGTSINVARLGIEAINYLSGDILVSMASGDSITSGSSGIFVNNDATAIDASANSKITITANGTIASGQNSALNGGTAGILAAYTGAINGPFVPDLAVTGTVLINNNANITAAAGWGIDAYNYGNGSVTVNDTALTVSGAQTGIGAYQDSGGTGDVVVTVGVGSTVTGVTGDAIDVINGGGTGNVSVTENGTANGAANGINAIENGGGKITIGGSGNITGQSGYGIFAEQSGTGLGGILINGAGNVTGAGSSFDGILAILNAIDGADVTVDQTGNVSGGDNGIEAITYGTGNVSVATGANVTITGAALWGIHADQYGTGKILVTTATGDQIKSASSGILAVSHDAATSQSPYSTITVNAYGALNSGTTLNLSGSRPAGILAGYDGAASGTGTLNGNILGDVFVNNYANITSGQTGATQVADGIRAFNYGVGNVTVTDGTWNNVTNGPGTVITDTYNEINAYTYNSGNTLVSMAPDDSIISGGSGINAGNDATAIDQSAHSTVTINAYGAINSGSTTSGSRPAGIQAGYNASVSSSTPDANVFGDVFINNYANITAAGGDGIRAFNYGVGSVTVIDGTLNNVNGGQGTTISASGQYGIDAFNYFAGNILVSTAAGDSVSSGSVGIIATNNSTALPQSANSTITVNAYGTINAGSTLTTGGNRSGGILAAYNGVASGNSAPNTNVFGDVLINNYANITGGQTGDSLTTDGIRAGNYGIGNITVVDGTLNNVANGPGTTITATQYGIDAVSFNPGSILVSASPRQFDLVPGAPASTPTARPQRLTNLSTASLQSTPTGPLVRARLWKSVTVFSRSTPFIAEVLRQQ